MGFDRRQEEILTAVVEEYIQTAEPVGSKTVVRRGVRASSATVRNQMSDLSAQGFLSQPHPSAGRLPTTLAFRYYVDHLGDRLCLDPAVKELVDQLFGTAELSAEELIPETARLASELSRQVGLVLMVPLERVRLRSVFFHAAGPGRIRVVFQLGSGALEERFIRNEWGLDPVMLQRLGNLVSLVAPGRTLSDLRRELIRQMEESRTQASALLKRAVEVSERLAAAEQPEVIVRGQSHLFEVPEFSELTRLRELIQTLEDQRVLVRILERVALSPGTRVILGAEFEDQAFRGCAMIVGDYGRGELPAGRLALIGPTRMDYARLIPLVQYTAGMISERLRRTG